MSTHNETLGWQRPWRGPARDSQSQEWKPHRTAPGNRDCLVLGRSVSCCQRSHGKMMDSASLDGCRVRAAVLAVKSLLAQHMDNLEVPHGLHDAIPASGSMNPRSFAWNRPSQPKQLQAAIQNPSKNPCWPVCAHAGHWSRGVPGSLAGTGGAALQRKEQCPGWQEPGMG